MPGSLSYYRSGEGDCNMAVDDRELVVNCAGQVVTEQAFVSDRPMGRRDYYLMALVGGKMRIRIAGEERSIEAGQAVIFPPREPYYYVFAGEEELSYYWAHFTGSAAERMIRQAGLRTDALFPLLQEEQHKTAFQSLMESFMRVDEWQETEAAGRLLVLLAGLGRSASGKPLRPAIEPVRRSLNHMEANYGKNISVSELAAMEYMSVSRYSALFRACTGLAPKEYLIRLRMRSATEMLTRTSMSVSQIARTVGYEDPLYFSRLFKKHTGTSPRAMRKTL